MKAVLDAPDPGTRTGVRDQAMLYLGFAAGLRVSELVGLRLDDLELDGPYPSILIHEKARGNAVSRCGKRPPEHCEHGWRFVVLHPRPKSS